MNEAIQGGSSKDIVLKCILYGNSSELGFNGNPVVQVDTSLVQGGAANRGKGNSDKNPLFVKQPTIGLSIEGDLNLKHESNLSIENIGYHEHGWNTDVHWTYSEEELDGPQSWLHLCSAKPGPSSCGGSRQSPIDIVTTSVVNADSFRLSEDYEQHTIEVENNGHTLEFEADNDVLTLNGSKYVLKQFHFHTPSEHKMDGKQYPMEIHFVHQDTTTKLLTVLGVFVELGPTEHPLLNTFIKNLPGKADAKCDNNFKFSIENLMPENRECYQYKGSLTTPPCSEIVHWNVFKKPLKATPKQIEAFQKREHTNNRPTQGLNGRPIYLGKLRPKVNCKTLNGFYVSKNYLQWTDGDRNTAIWLLASDGTPVATLQSYKNDLLYRLIRTKCE
jgi:carbonic anhydrase